MKNAHQGLYIESLAIICVCVCACEPRSSGCKARFVISQPGRNGQLYLYNRVVIPVLLFDKTLVLLQNCS